MLPIGDVLLTSPAFRGDPYPFYARLRSEAPVYRARLPDGRAAWLVSRYDDVLAVLKDARFVKERASVQTPEQAAREPWTPKMFRPLGRTMIDRDGDDHARLRSPVHRAFTPRMVEGLRGRIETLADRMLDAVERLGRIDVIADYALPLSATIIAELLGVPDRDRHRFHRWTNALVSIAPTSWGKLKMIPHVIAALRSIRKLIAARRADPRDDLTSALVTTVEAGDRLGEDELVGMIFLLLIAGHETTVNLIGHGVLALLQHPGQRERLQADPGLIRPAVEELLRYDPPLHMGSERYAREDAVLAGRAIPRGEMILPILASANRDEREFDRPDELDLAREPNRHVAFGQGAHFCPGAPLARLQGSIAINTLLRRLYDPKLAVPPEALRRRPGMGFHSLETLPVAFARRRAPRVGATGAACNDPP